MMINQASPVSPHRMQRRASVMVKANKWRFAFVPEDDAHRTSQVINFTSLHLRGPKS